jgi:hypothetical protein
MSDQQTIEMKHPDTGESVKALVVGRVYDDNGRYVGQQLRFPGEPKPKELTFSQIYVLQGSGAVV